MHLNKRIIVLFAHSNFNKTFLLQSRTASNYKRSLNNTLPAEQLQHFKQEIFAKGAQLSGDDWRKARELLIKNYRHIAAHNVDAVIVGLCNDAQYLPVAKNYIEFLRAQNTQPNLASLCRLLRVYNAAHHAGILTSAEQQEVLDICLDLRRRHELLDASSCENLICGLVCTTEWQQAKELLDMTKLSSTPSLTAYTELCIKAFQMQDMQYGWQLLKEMLHMRKQPRCQLYIAYFKAIAQLPPQQFTLEFEKLLSLLEEHELQLTESVLQYIEHDLCKQQPQVFTLARIKLQRLGKCSNCGHFMQNNCVADAEFAQLRDTFLQKVLIRKDIFQKSTPAEIERFQQFVAKTAPYDCVIDGLNVAYSAGAQKSPELMTKFLCAVVQYFQRRQKRILILGRKHMQQWPKQQMQYVRKNALMFLTNDLTQDDPFLLYATLKSGPLTDFFSRDLMRSHAHLLGPELKSIFRRWQMEHQYSLISKLEQDDILVKEPIRHLICAHKVNQTWHVPYRKEYHVMPPETLEVPEHWFCLQFQKCS